MSGDFETFLKKNKYMEKDWHYDIKCRRCGKITRMHFGTHDQISADAFKVWASKHSTFPIQKPCECEHGMMMFHDIIGYGDIFHI